MLTMASTHSEGVRGTRIRLVAMIAGVVVALDAVTKAIAVRALAGRGLVNVLGGRFHFELYRNFAGPGNILQGRTVLVSILSACAVGVMTLAAPRVRTTSSAVALGLLLGGGIGNLLDRLLRAPGPMRGGVVDWIKPSVSGASLNLADLSINAAMIALLVGLLLDWSRGRRAKSERGATPA
jgi:signal peptidase II